MTQNLRRQLVEKIHAGLTQLVEPGTVIELRIPKLFRRNGTDSGYFDNLRTAAEYAARYDGQAPDVYFTLNPVSSVLLARADNHLRQRTESTTSDTDIIRRRWLPIDCDPKVEGRKRPAQISSTEEEHRAALDKVRAVREWLTLAGWPDPILADSGNGGALLYCVDMPNDDATTKLITRCLEALAHEFNDTSAEIDTTVYNAARIWKVYGTHACKGDSTLERPHRQAQILEAPSTMKSVELDLLQALAQLLPEESRDGRPHAVRDHNGNPTNDIEAWLNNHNLRYRIKDATVNGAPATFYILNPCPFDSNHRDARIIQFANGALSFGCFHDSCQSYDWRALREKLEPGCYDRHGNGGIIRTVAAPFIDREGSVCCPHCGKQLQRSKNGNGWRCLKEDGALCFWWLGEGYQPLADQHYDDVMAAPLPLRLTSTAYCPELPAIAQLPDELAVGACPWLDRYIAFSQRWAPDAYVNMHEAVGLWVLATVAARRAYLRLCYYTNLFIAVCARSSLFTKTTVALVGVDIISAAGLAPLLLPDDTTPEAFIRGLTQKVPKEFAEMNDEQRAFVRQRLAFAGQRSWFYDEFGMKLSALMRENGIMADFRGLLRIFDDNKSSYERATISRAADCVRLPYLSLLANLTPADMRPHASRGSALWSDGFLARFAIITPPVDAPDTNERFPDEERIIPLELFQPLRDWHQRLGIPAVSINQRLDDKGNGTELYDITVDPLPVQSCSASRDVIEAFYTYRGALKTLTRALDNDDLDASYTRLPIKAMRIALLFASLENDGQIELPHWARAQQITERWRADLHHLVDQLNESEASPERTREDKIGRLFERFDALAARDVGRYLHISTSEAQQILDRLVRAGEMVVLPGKRTNRYAPAGSTIGPVASVALSQASQDSSHCDTKSLLTQNDDPTVASSDLSHKNNEGDGSDTATVVTDQPHDWRATQVAAAVKVDAMHLASRAQALIDADYFDKACAIIEQMPDGVFDKVRLLAIITAQRELPLTSVSEQIGDKGKRMGKSEWSRFDAAQAYAARGMIAIGNYGLAHDYAQFIKNREQRQKVKTEIAQAEAQHAVQTARESAENIPTHPVEPMVGGHNSRDIKATAMTGNSVSDFQRSK